MLDQTGGRATLALETGDCFSGRLFGGAAPRGLGASDPTPPPRGGEVVFHTGMTGYQEILTDPSYAGQIVVFTAPHIGNYGIHLEEDESAGVHPAGVVVRDHCRRTFHQRADRSLEDVLRRAHVPGLSSVDTRALTRRIRDGGSCRGVIGLGDPQELVRAARELPLLAELDPVSEVTCREPWHRPARTAIPQDGVPLRVVVLDFGIKRSILDHLVDRGCELFVLPAHASAEQIRRACGGREPDGIFLSNGPGDPARLETAVRTIEELLATDVAIFGICLGHQLLARALGARTYKLPFGHHGANHPVQCLADRRVAITSHNHNYAVDAESLDPRRVRVTHLSLNDRCLEGLEVPGRPVFSVQYHPEAAPGPRDGRFLFDRFRRDMVERRRLRAAAAEGGR